MYLVSQPLLAVGMSEGNAQGWKIVQTMHGGAKPPPKWVMKCPVFWLIFNNFVTFHHFFTKLGNLIWVFVPNNLT